MELRPAVAKRRTDTCGWAARRFVDGILAAIQFINDLLSAEEKSIWMSMGVVPKDMISRCNFSGQIWILLDVFPKNEKSRPHIMLLQKIQQPWCDSRIGTIIERQCACVSGPGHGRSE
jgi:hypothetical protein